MLPVAMGSRWVLVLLGCCFSVEFEFIQTLWDGLILFIPTMLRGFGVFSSGFFLVAHFLSVLVVCTERFQVIGFRWQAMLSASDSMLSAPVSTSSSYSISNALKNLVYCLMKSLGHCNYYRPPNCFFLHPNIEVYLLSCWWYSKSIMWSTLCPSFHVLGSPEFQTCIQHSGLELPLAAFIPLLTRARKPLQEAFRGIENDMNSTFGSLTGCRSGGKTRKFYSQETWMEDWETKNNSILFLNAWWTCWTCWTFEFCREHVGKPSSCIQLYTYSKSRIPNMQNVISPAHGIQCC